MSRYRLFQFAILVAGFIVSACDDGTRPSTPTTLTLVAGNQQTAEAGEPVAEPLRVRLLDQEGKPMRGVAVGWSVTAGGGSVSAASGSTDDQGEARAVWTLGTQVGSNAVTATVQGLAPVTFTAETQAGPPARILAQGGGGQSAKAATTAADSIGVKVTDLFGNAVSGVNIVWTVVEGAGSVNAGASVTSANGIARKAWTFGPRAGVNTVIAAAAPIAGDSVAFHGTATPNATIAGAVAVTGGLISYGGMTPPPVAADLRAATRDARIGTPDERSLVPNAAPAGAAAESSTRLIVSFQPQSVGAPPPGSAAYLSRAQSEPVAVSLRQRLDTPLAGLPGRVEGVSPAVLSARVAVDDPGRLAEIRAELLATPGVAAVEPEIFYHRSGGDVPMLSSPAPAPAAAANMLIPNDPLFGPQSWHYNIVDLPRAWTTTTGSSDVLVAVIDDGIRFDHPAIAGNLTNDGYDFVSPYITSYCGGLIDISGDGNAYDPDPTNPMSIVCSEGTLYYNLAHGLHVAGTIGATGNDGVGVAGVNWNVRIRPIRGLGINGSGSNYDLAQAILYAAGLPADNGSGGQVQAPSGARIINMSFGGSTNSPVLQQAIQAAAQTGALLIAAAGNDGTTVANYPASYDEVVSVSAVNAYGERAGYSSYGGTVDIAAPGGDYDDGGWSFTVASLDWDFVTNSPAYSYSQGTSMAAPHVTGVAALIAATDPGLSAAGIRARLLDYAVDIGPAGLDIEFGHGLLNARNSLTGTMAPARQVLARLLHGETGALARTLPLTGSGASFEFAELEDGQYLLVAGLDEEGDGEIGVPGRVWGAYTSGDVIATIGVDGAGVYPANLSIGFPIETEPNDSPATASRILPNSYMHGRILTPSDADVYVVTLPAGTHTFETSGWNGDACGYATAENTRIQLATEDGLVLETNDDFGNSTCSRISRHLAAGTYYLTVMGTRGMYYRIGVSDGQ